MTDAKQVRNLLSSIVTVQQRILDRFRKLRRTNPDAVSDQELDLAELALLRDQLELAKFDATAGQG